MAAPDTMITYARVHRVTGMGERALSDQPDGNPPGLVDVCSVLRRESVYSASPSPAEPSPPGQVEGEVDNTGNGNEAVCKIRQEDRTCLGCIWD